MFNPSDIGIDNGNIFGLPFTRDNAKVMILPVPWEVTVSYGTGAADGPKAILEESLQVDLFDPDIKDAWKTGIFMEPISKSIFKKSSLLRELAKKCINHLEEGGDVNDPKIESMRDEINDGSRDLNKYIEDWSTEILNNKKIPAVLGGDHSSPLGLMEALGKKYESYGILHIDAHADLRNAYEGFEFSHASIMNNALKIKSVSKLVQVGIRDYCEEEDALVRGTNGRAKMFTDREIRRSMFAGKTWAKICADIVKELPKDVYISFDIDGLEPHLCPNTGTPVPGGLEFEEAFYLFEQVVKTGRKIIGFDLCEVVHGKHTNIDVITGARALYRLANLAA